MKRGLIYLFVLMVLFGGCRGRGYRPLMPTPVLFTDLDIDPFDYMPKEDQTPMVEVFYATNRQARLLPDNEVRYGNRMDNRVHVGRGVVRIGDEEMTWDQLHEASKSGNRDEKIPVTLEVVEEHGVLHQSLEKELRSQEVLGNARFADGINAALAQSDEKIIKIYVHGFKVDFDHGAVLGAQFRHFAMREGVTIAFDWACRQTPLAYFSDVKRAQRSVVDLVALLDFLSQETDAQTISIISWSAGAPIHSAALVALRERHPDWEHEQLFTRYKLDEMLFAASDMDFRTFIDEYKQFYDLPRTIMITVCNDDRALHLARRLHGQSRLGAANDMELVKEEIEELQQHYAHKSEVIDVTRSQKLMDAQEIDTVMHRYWFDNTWISTDILMSIYLDLPAEKRGLTQDPNHRSVWYFAEDYPEDAIGAFKDVIGIQGMTDEDIRRHIAETQKDEE